MTPTEISAQLTGILEYIQTSYDDRDGNVLVDRLTVLQTYLAQTAELLSECQYILDRVRGTEAEALMPKNLKAAEFKIILEMRTASERRLYALCERTNATLTHVLDATRSQLSYEKQLAHNELMTPVGGRRA